MLFVLYCAAAAGGVVEGVEVPEFAVVLADAVGAGVGAEPVVEIAVDAWRADAAYGFAVAGAARAGH